MACDQALQERYRFTAQKQERGRCAAHCVGGLVHRRHARAVVLPWKTLNMRPAAITRGGPGGRGYSSG